MKQDSANHANRSSSPIRGWLREVTQHSLTYGLGAALQAALNFVLLPLYTKQFAADEFGVFRMAVLAASLAGAVFYLGAYSSLSRFYFDPDDDAERRVVAGTAATLTLVGGVLQMIAIAAAARPLSQVLLGSPRYAPFFLVAFATSALTFVNQIFLLMLRLKRRSTVVVVANLASVLLSAAAVLWLVLSRRWGVMGALAGALVGQAAVLPALAWLAQPVFVWHLSRKQLRRQLAFGLPAVMIGLGYYALDGAGRFVMGRMQMLTELGVYSFGYSIGLVVQMLFVQPFAQIWNPMRIEYRKHADAPRLSALVTTYYTLAGLALVVALSLFAREIVGLVGRRPEYAAASRVIPIILLSHLIYGAVNLVDTGLLVANRLVYHVIFFWSVLVLNVGLNYWLVPRYGYMGSAWATLVSYALLVTALYVTSNRFLANSIEPRRLLIAAGTAVAAIVARAMLPVAGAAAIVTEAGMFAALIAAWYVFVLSARERAWCRQQTMTLRRAT